MDGKKVNFSDGFIVPSTKSIDMMMYPGDPNGSAGNVCNCRCTVAFVPMRDANGRAIPANQITQTGPARLFIDLAIQSAAQLITGGLIANLIAAIEGEE